MLVKVGVFCGRIWQYWFHFTTFNYSKYVVIAVIISFDLSQKQQCFIPFAKNGKLLRRKSLILGILSKIWQHLCSIPSYKHLLRLTKVFPK